MTQQQSYAAAQRRRTIATLGLFGAILVGAGLAAFSGPGTKQVSPEPAPAPAAQPAPAQRATTAAKPKRERREKRTKKVEKPLVDENVVWVDPPEWKRLPRSGMRYASYELPAAKGDPRIGELNVFILSGDVEANIQRWVAEFSNFDLKTVVRTERTVNGMPQHIVEIPKGHFNGGMGDTKASDNYGLLGAIVIAPSGAEFFFKLTGPSKVVKAARKPFYKMLDSIRVEKSAAPAGAAPAAEAAAASSAPSAPGAAAPEAAAPAAAPAPAAPAAAEPPAAGAAGAAPHP